MKWDSNQQKNGEEEEEEALKNAKLIDGCVTMLMQLSWKQQK